MTSDHNLKGRLRWVDKVEGERANTLARFVIELDDLPIWPVWGDDDSDLEVFVDDLLSYLTDCWAVLLLRQTFPFPLDAERPSLLRAGAERAAARGPRDGRSEQLLAAAISFSQVHDLSRCFGGLYELPAFWMVRQEQDFLIETADRLERVSLGSWIRFATELGDEIAERLIKRAPDKWQSLVNSWHDRDTGDPVRIAALATGQPKEVADQLIKDGLVPSVASVNTAANDNDELRVAARMVGAIPYGAIKTVLSAAKAIPHRPSQTLEALGRRARNEVTNLPESAHPHEQGVHAARWVRQEENLDATARADPLGTLSRHSVQMIQNDIGPATLDALAVWGPTHGPGVIFNLGSKRLRAVGGRPPLRRLKVLAAHELCHLLLDHERTVAAVDILGGRMPVASEQRANAFAAEFLLPAQTAVVLWRESELAHSRDGVDMFLNRVSDRFDVSRLMAAWQLDHGLAGSSPDIVFWLDELFPSRGGR
jgi:uncharacterized protein DUF955